MKVITEKMAVKLQKVWGTGYIDCNLSRFIASDVDVKFNFDSDNMQVCIEEPISPIIPLVTFKKVNKTLEILGWVRGN